MLKAYIEGVAALRNRKELAYKVLGKYFSAQATRWTKPISMPSNISIERQNDPAVIQTVLNWENKGDASVNEFFDNSIIDRIIKEGFVERLYK